VTIKADSELAALGDGIIDASVRPSVCLSVAKMRTQKHEFLKSNLELWSLLTTYRKSYMSFSKNPLLDPKTAILKIVKSP